MEPPPCSPLTDPSPRQDRDDEESVASTPVFDPDETVNSQATAATDVTQPHAQLQPQRRINVSQVRPPHYSPSLTPSPRLVVSVCIFVLIFITRYSTPKRSACDSSSRSTKSARTKSMCHSLACACPPLYPCPVSAQQPRIPWAAPAPPTTMVMEKKHLNYQSFCHRRC